MFGVHFRHGAALLLLSSEAMQGCSTSKVCIISVFVLIQPYAVPTWAPGLGAEAGVCPVSRFSRSRGCHVLAPPTCSESFGPCLGLPALNLLPKELRNAAQSKGQMEDPRQHSKLLSFEADVLEASGPRHYCCSRVGLPSRTRGRATWNTRRLECRVNAESDQEKVFRGCSIRHLEMYRCRIGSPVWYL